MKNDDPLPLPSPLPCVLSKTSMCVPAPRAHMFQHVRVVPVHTGAFWTTHGSFSSVSHHTPHTTPTPLPTPRDNMKRRGDKMKRRDERIKRREEKRREENIKRDTMCYVCGCVVLTFPVFSILPDSRIISNFRNYHDQPWKHRNFPDIFCFENYQLLFTRNLICNHFGPHGMLLISCRNAGRSSKKRWWSKTSNTCRRCWRASGESFAVPGEVEVQPGATHGHDSKWERQRQISHKETRGRIRTPVEQWGKIGVNSVKKKDKGKRNKNMNGVRLCFSMARLLQRTKRVVQNESHIEEQPAAEGCGQFKGWTVAAEEAVKTEKEKKQRLNTVGPDVVRERVRGLCTSATVVVANNENLAGVIPRQGDIPSPIKKCEGRTNRSWVNFSGGFCVSAMYFLGTHKECSNEELLESVSANDGSSDRSNRRRSIRLQSSCRRRLSDKTLVVIWRTL